MDTFYALGIFFGLFVGIFAVPTQNTYQENEEPISEYARLEQKLVRHESALKLTQAEIRMFAESLLELKQVVLDNQKKIRDLSDKKEETSNETGEDELINEEEQLTSLPDNRPPPVIMSTSNQLKDKCPEEFFFHHHSCYKRQDGEFTWKEAKNYCAAKKSDLISIDNDLEQDLLATISHESGGNPTWIGGINANGTWIWSSNKPLVYTAWTDNANINSKAPNCIQISAATLYRWEPKPCVSKARSLVCEIENIE